MPLEPISEKEHLEKMGIRKDKDGNIKIENIGDRIDEYINILNSNTFGFFRKIMNEYYKKTKKLNKLGKFEKILPIESFLIDSGSRLIRIILIGSLSSGSDLSDEMRIKIDSIFASNFLHGIVCEMIIADINVEEIVKKARSVMGDLHDARQRFKIERNECYAHDKGSK